MQTQDLLRSHNLEIVPLGYFYSIMSRSLNLYPAPTGQ